MTGLVVTRDGVKATINKLIITHQETIQEMLEGQRFFNRGEDITGALYKRVVFEIEQCQMVLQAVDEMKVGDIQRAAELCSQIQEHMLNVH